MHFSSIACCKLYKLLPENSKDDFDILLELMFAIRKDENIIVESEMLYKNFPKQIRQNINFCSNLICHNPYIFNFLY